MSTVLQLLAVNGRPASASPACPPAALSGAQTSPSSSTSLNSDQLLQRLREQHARCSTPLFSPSASVPTLRPQTEYRRNFNRSLSREPAAHPLKAASSISSTAAAQPHSAFPPSNGSLPLRKSAIAASLDSTTALQPSHQSQAHRQPPSHARPPSSTSSTPSTKQAHLHTTHPVFNPKQLRPASPPPVKPHACKPHRPGSILVPPPPAPALSHSGVQAHAAHTHSGVQAHTPVAALKPSPSLGHSAWTSGSMGRSRGAFGDAVPGAASARGGLQRGVQPVPGAAGVLPFSQSRPVTPLAARPASSPITRALLEHTPVSGKAVSPRHHQSKPPSLAAWPRASTGLSSSSTHAHSTPHANSSAQATHTAAAPNSFSTARQGLQACGTSPGDQAAAFPGQPHSRSPRQHGLRDEHAAATQHSEQTQPQNHQHQHQHHQFHHQHQHQVHGHQPCDPHSLAASPCSAPSPPPQHSTLHPTPDVSTQPATASSASAPAAAGPHPIMRNSHSAAPPAFQPTLAPPHTATPSSAPFPSPSPSSSPAAPAGAAGAARSSQAHMPYTPGPKQTPLATPARTPSPTPTQAPTPARPSSPQSAPLQSLLSPTGLQPRRSSPAMRPGSTASCAWSTDVQVPTKLSPPSQAPQAHYTVPTAPGVSGIGQHASTACGSNNAFGGAHSSRAHTPGGGLPAEQNNSVVSRGAGGLPAKQNSSSVASSTLTDLAAKEAAAQRHLEQLRGDGVGGQGLDESQSSRHSSRASTPQQPPKASKEDEDCSSIDIVYSSARSSRASTPRLSTPQTPWAPSVSVEPHANSRPRTPLLHNKQLGARSVQPKLHTRSRLGMPEKAGVGLGQAAAGGAGHFGGQEPMVQHASPQPDLASSQPGHHSACRSQHAGRPAFVRQAAPMVLCLDDITKSSDEVLELEVKRKLEGLSLEDLHCLNSLL